MGFGAGPFGEYPFGDSDWSDRVFWGSVPLEHRNLDTDGLHQALYEAIAEEMNELRWSIQSIPEQRDPYKVRNREVTETVEFSAAEVVDDPHLGVATKLSVNAGQEIEDLVPGWTVIIEDKKYTVLRVVSYKDPLGAGYASDPNEVWIDAEVAPVLGGPTSYTFQAPPLLDYLAKDFGITLDENEPDFLQRSSVANVTKWWALKSTERSYEIRGEIAGFTVEVKGLYLIQDTALLSVLPADRTFVFNGLAYTDIEPRSVRFDDFIADAVQLDVNYIYEDSSPDGMSEAMAWAEDLGSVFVLSAVQMTPAELAAAQLPHGWRSYFLHADLEDIATMDQGAFSLILESEFNPGEGIYPIGTEFVIDREVDRTGGVMAQVYIGAQGTPLVTGYYRLRYRPEAETTCRWCRSHRILVTMEPTDVLIASGADLTRAAQRLVEKLQQLIPIHVRLADAIYLVRGTVVATRTVTGEILMVTEGVAPATRRFDDFAADEFTLDETVREVTGTVLITP